MLVSGVLQARHLVRPAACSRPLAPSRHTGCSIPLDQRFHQQQRRRRSSRGIGGTTTVAAAAAAAPAAAAAALCVSPLAVFDVATLAVMPFYLAIVVAPRQLFTRRLFGSNAFFVLAAALYAALLGAWAPLLAPLASVVQGAAAGVNAAVGAGSIAAALRLGMPSMPAFAALFASPHATALAWVHLVLLDLLQARWGWGGAGGAGNGR